MMGTQRALIRRELWEHRSLFVVPVVIAAIELLGLIVGQLTVSTATREIDLALLGASHLGENERAAALNVFLLGISWLFVLAMAIVAVFYCLDALYAERKDKSILFWRSLPVTDAETVISKLATATLVLPIITLVMIAITHLVALAIASAWVGVRGANAWHLLWTAAPFLDNWVSTLVLLLALSIWLSPFFGWFLFVSAFTKRSPFLVGVLPLVVVPLLGRIFFGSWALGQILLERAPFSLPLFDGFDGSDFDFDDESEILELAESGVSLLSFIDIGKFVTSPSVWLGMIVCGLFSFAAIYVRRYRDES